MEAFCSAPFEHKSGMGRQRTQSSKTEASMKKMIAALCAACLLLVRPVSVQAAAPPDGIEARAALLMDAQTGQVLFDKNGSESLEPASITKILTAMLALEQLDPARPISASAGAVDIPSWATSAHLKAGEALTREQAVYALLLPSGNDAANVIAEAVSGSQQAFAQLMNERAAALGAQNTHFTNASGLPDEEHRTTALDMALITRGALQTPGFLAYFGAESYRMAGNGLSAEREFHNTHRMLRTDYPEYDRTVIGGKTGYTDSAGYTLVTAAQREGRTLICVVLNSDRSYQDTAALLDYGFQNFIPYTYQFETPSVRLPLMDGEREAGTALFAHQAAVPLFIREGTDAGQITVEYGLPQNPRQSLEGTVRLLLPAQEGEIPPSLTLPLQIQSIELFSPARPALKEEQSQKGTERHLPAWSLLMAAAAGGLAVRAVEVFRIRRRARRKLRRSPQGRMD
jgi:D-alanyl-D-alanine carboxypeptidase (penicillin-binding protein 5/6)